MNESKKKTPRSIGCRHARRMPVRRNRSVAMDDRFEKPLACTGISHFRSNRCVLKNRIVTREYPAASNR